VPAKDFGNKIRNKFQMKPYDSKKLLTIIDKSSLNKEEKVFIEADQK
jgi:hypothetical protein